MKNTNTKRVPNSLIMNTELKEKEKTLLYFLLAQANIPGAIYKLCKTSYKDILRELDITVDKNYKKKAKKLLDVLVKKAYIDYIEDSNNNLIIEVLIPQPNKNFTRMPYALVNNKNIPLNLVPCFMAILKHEFMTGECNPSLETIAKYTGLGLTKVKERIKQLEQLNILKVERTKGGTRVTNTFITSNGTSYFYELIDVEPRFEYEVPKKKLVAKKSVKSIINQDALKNKEKEQIV